MKILVPIKRVPDPDHRIRVDLQRIALELSDVPHIINPFDANALEEAVRIREGPVPDAEIIAIGIGDPAWQQELRTSLAMGADRAIHVGVSGPPDPWNVARILRAITERESPDLVLMGKQAVDDDSNQAGQFVAGLLGWPQATFVSQIEFIPLDPEPSIAGHQLRVARETDTGIETIRLRLPAVITADLRLNEPRYAALPAILKAKRKPIETIPLTELNIELSPRVERIALQEVSSSRKCQYVQSVDELLDQLFLNRCL
ncbi:MAG: electron transfer flavoprotein subunit beta/FixA family protein [Pirellulales bacterium]|nr:electron transfer flavoprotein subunit beta/FixA family protein [Pirellulales bacterium]